MSKIFSITDLATEFGVTPRTLRHYEGEGLLTPVREGLSRLYSPRDRSRLKVALRARRLGFTLTEIRVLFGLYDRAYEEGADLDGFLEQLARRRTALTAQREDIEIMLHEITFFEDQCKKWKAQRKRDK